MADIRIFTSIDNIPREAWNACYPGALEDFDYLRAVEHSDMAGFHWRYIAAYDGTTLIAAMPAFLHEYALDTTLAGPAKKLSSLLRSQFPSALVLKLACLGSPVMEQGIAGFAPHVPVTEQPSLLTHMLEAFEHHANTHGYRLMGLKDVPETQEALWQPALSALGYRDTAGMPTAQLALAFDNIDDYLTRLSPATRKDMRRKLKARDGLRIEYRTDLDDVLPQVIALYRDTRARADMQFEDLTEAYFTGVLAAMPGRAVCVLYYAGDRLLAANLLLKNSTTLLDKFFCMDAARGREFNLYFISWFTNLEYCLGHGLTHYQSGQAGYENKLRLGSSLMRTAMYFKHRNRWIHGALRLAAPWLAADPTREAA